MTSLAIASLKARTTSMTAAFLSVLLGVTLVGAFATLLESGLASSGADAETLVTMGAVVGGWGSLIVLFSVASTLTLTVRHRAAEIGLMRVVGATPRQVRRLAVRETFVVALAAALVAWVPAVLLGRLVFALVQGADLVSGSVEAAPGFVSVAMTGLVLTFVSCVAAGLAGRRGSRVAASTSLRESAIETRRMPEWRVLLGLLFVAGGLTLSILTVTVMADSDDPYAPMATAGEASVVTSIGLAILAPALLRWAATLAGPILRQFGAPGSIAAYNAERRAALLSGVLMPVILFVGISTGTAYLMAIESKVAAERTTTAEDQTIELLNGIVVAMIAVFAAIMIVNAVAAVVAGRREEIRRQRLIGATPGQVTGALLMEGSLVALAGIALGGLAALTTALPYSAVKLDRLTPGMGPWFYVVAGLIAVGLTMGSTYAAANRAHAAG